MFALAFAPVALAGCADASPTASSPAPATAVIVAAPVVSIGMPAAPASGTEGASLSFQGSSTNPNGGTLSFAWAWGDGTADGAAASTAHAFRDNGVFRVTLTVSDGRGGVGSATRDVTIANSPPTVSRLYLRVDLLNRPPAGQSWPIEFTITDRNAADGPFAYAIDWGDGTTSTTGNRATLGNVAASHVYSAPGSRTVRIALTDKDGGSSVRTIPVEVQASSAPIGGTGGRGGISFP